MKKKNFYTFAAVLAAGILSGSTIQALAEGDIWSYTTYHTDDGAICIDFEEVEVLLPESWSGKCRMSTSEEEVAFYQIKSRDLYTQELGFPNGGWLFSICCSQNYDFLDMPSYQTLGTGEEGIYYIAFPTDMQGYPNDTEALNEFQQMSADVSWISDNISLTSGEAALANLSGDSIFPQSSTEYLDAADLESCSADDLQMAINEIYARHHRKFVLPEVQEYFNARSWYSGYIEADDFDVSVMNEYEGANIDLMVKTMKNKSGQTSNSSSAAASANTKDAYGMVIETGEGYIRLRQQDGSALQVWYDNGRLSDLGISRESIKVGATASLIYDTTSYEALNLLIW